MMEDEKALTVLSKHGKSFRFAGMFLSQKQLEQAAQLYRFCRWIDDIADDTPNKRLAKSQLLSIQKNIRDGKTDAPQVAEFLVLQHRLNMPSILPISLIDGVLTDLDTVEIQNSAALVRYAYCVAGTVGLMMCPILKADPRGYSHAVDLGIAMQLTNIARDVMEDARLGRRYLPQTWCPLSPQQILDNSPETQRQVMQAVEKLLALAETYYASGAEGYPFLPVKSRRAISIAAVIYREIGIKLQSQQLRYWRGRTVVPLHRKLQLSFGMLLLRKSARKSAGDIRHATSLHEDLQDLLPWTQS
jgi:phytoene synthase